MHSLQTLRIVFILLCLSPFTLQASQCATAFSMQADKMTDKMPQFFKELGYSPSYRQNLFHNMSHFFRSRVKKGKSFLILRKGEVLPEKVSFVSLKYPEDNTGQPILVVKNQKGKLLHLSPQDINSVGHIDTIKYISKKMSLLDDAYITFTSAIDLIEAIIPHSAKLKLLKWFKGKSFYKNQNFEIFTPPNFLKIKENAQLANDIKKAVEKFKLELKNSNFLPKYKFLSEHRFPEFYEPPFVNIILSNRSFSHHPAYAYGLSRKNSMNSMNSERSEYVVVLNVDNIKSKMEKRMIGDLDIPSVVLHEITHNYITDMTIRLIKIYKFNTIEEALADYMPHLYAGYQPMETRNFKNLSITLYDKNLIEGFDLLSSHMPRDKYKLYQHQYSIFISHFLYQMEQILGKEIMKPIFANFAKNLWQSSDKMRKFIKYKKWSTTKHELYEPIIEVFYALAIFSRTLDNNKIHNPEKIEQAQEFLAQFKEEMGNHPFISDVLSSK